MGSSSASASAIVDHAAAAAAHEDEDAAGRAAAAAAADPPEQETCQGGKGGHQGQHYSSQCLRFRVEVMVDADGGTQAAAAGELQELLVYHPRYAMSNAISTACLGRHRALRAQRRRLPKS